MNKKEQAKSDIETLRSILLIVLTAIFAVVGYGIINIDTLARKQVYLGTGAISLLLVSLAILVRLYLAIRKKL